MVTVQAALPITPVGSQARRCRCLWFQTLRPSSPVVEVSSPGNSSKHRCTTGRKPTGHDLCTDVFCSLINIQALRSFAVGAIIGCVGADVQRLGRRTICQLPHRERGRRGGFNIGAGPSRLLPPRLPSASASIARTCMVVPPPKSMACVNVSLLFAAAASLTIEVSPYSMFKLYEPST